MKVLIVVNADWYFWSHRLSLAQALKRQHHDVVVAAAPERGMRNRIEGAGFPFSALAIERRSTSPRLELKTLRQFYVLYRRERPDLVHHVTIKPVIYGSLTAKVLRIPAVVNTIPGAGYVLRSGRSKLLTGLALHGYRLALSSANVQVIMQNPDDVEFFVSHGLVDRNKTTLIRGSGVDVSTFRPSPEPTGTPIVMLGARLIWEKGLQEFVDAAAELRKRNVGCRMVIVGAPDTKTMGSVSESILRRWHAGGQIEWWGVRSDMPEVMRQVNVVVLPTYYPEGVPKILLEAAASGRPLVATDVPGCREIVKPGKTGILVEPRNSLALADAIEQLLEDGPARARLGAFGRELVVAEFSEDVINEKTIRVYERAVSRMNR